ncbi:DUF4752 family protein [Escherichia coli]|uniref:DUF4752 family protein n=1 Tax=Escherichia coli TaxID=562 RepID=UPI000BE3FB5D
MNIDTTITLDTALNTGLALLGWLYIMFSAGRWLSSVFLKKWDKHRKQEWRQKAMNEFFGAFNIDNLESGEPARVSHSVYRIDDTDISANFCLGNRENN